MQLWCDEMFRGDADADYIYSIAIITDEKNRLYIFLPVKMFKSFMQYQQYVQSFLHS